jgi:hypothetical protein
MELYQAWAFIICKLSLTALFFLIVGGRELFTFQRAIDRNEDPIGWAIQCSLRRFAGGGRKNVAAPSLVKPQNGVAKRNASDVVKHGHN